MTMPISKGGVMVNETLVLERSERTTFVEAALVQDGSHPSAVAQQISLGQLSSTKLEHGFIAWVVRQVEARVDLSMDNRPFPSEVDWRYWLRNPSRLAVHSGIHVEVASVILGHLQVATAEGTSDGDDAPEFSIPARPPGLFWPGRRLRRDSHR